MMVGRQRQKKSVEKQPSERKRKIQKKADKVPSKQDEEEVRVRKEEEDEENRQKCGRETTTTEIRTEGRGRRTTMSSDMRVFIDVHLRS